MLGEIVEDNLFILGKAVEVYAKDSFWVPIPVKGKFGMALLIQKERVLILGSPNLKESVLKELKIGGEKIKILSSGLTT